MKVRLLFITALFCWTSCNEDIEFEELKEKSQKSSEKIAWTSLENETHLNYVLDAAGFTPSGNGRKSESGLEINTEDILRVLQDDSVNHIYTFEIENSSGITFSNLVIKELEGGFLGFVLRYEPSSGFTSMSDFTGKISRFNLDGELLSEKEMMNGKLITTVPQGKTSQSASCIEDIIVLTYCIEETPSGGDAPLARLQAGGDVYCWDVVNVISGPCPTNYVPPSSGGETGGTYYPGTGTNAGGTSGGTGSGENCRCPGSDSQEPSSDEVGVIPTDPDLSAITMKNMLNSEQQALLSNTFNNLMNKHTVFRNMFDYLVKHNVKLSFKMGIDQSAGGYNYETKTITFKDNSSITTDVLAEELYHAFQDSFYEGGLGAYDNVGRSNIEFEAKLFNDIIRALNGEQCCMTVQTSLFADYRLWIANITNDDTNLPTSFDVLQSEYYRWMQEFINSNPMYNFPIDYDLIPSSMFFLIMY